MAQELTKLVRDVHPRVLTEALQDEDEMSIAIFSLTVDPEQAAKALALLPEEKRVAVGKAIVQIETVPQSVFTETIQRLREKIEEMASQLVSFGDTRERLAEILARLPRSQQLSVISGIEKEDPESANLIREKTFKFDDLVRLSDMALRLILRLLSKDPKSLALALREASPELQERIFRNLSEDDAVVIQEEMELLGTVSRKDVEDARRRVMSIVRRLEQEGLFNPAKDLAEIGG